MFFCNGFHGCICVNVAKIKFSNVIQSLFQTITKNTSMYFLAVCDETFVTNYKDLMTLIYGKTSLRKEVVHLN